MTKERLISDQEKKEGLLEILKFLDKLGMASGVGIYLLWGIPASLTIAGISAFSYFLTELGEKGIKKWYGNFSGVNQGK